MYRKEQFDKLIYNPFSDSADEVDAKVSFGRLSHALSGINECTPIRDRGRLAKYILFMYDKATPLTTHEPDIFKRKEVAASLAGYDLEKDKRRVDTLFKLADQRISQVVMNFIKFQRSREWASLVSNEQLFWELQEGIMTEYTDFKDDEALLKAMDRKTMLARRVDDISQLIEKNESFLFNGDDILKEIASQSRSEATPEMFAEIDV